jgi:hypothetical protein
VYPYLTKDKYTSVEFFHAIRNLDLASFCLYCMILLLGVCIQDDVMHSSL